MKRLIERYLILSWVVACGAVGLLVCGLDYIDRERYIVIAYGLLMFVGCGLGAFRTARQEGDGRIRVLSAALAFVMILLAIRGGLFLVDGREIAPEDPDTIGETIEDFFTGMVIAALGFMGFFLYSALDRDDNRSGWAGTQVWINPFSKTAKETDGLKIQNEVAEVKETVAEMKPKVDEVHERIVNDEDQNTGGGPTTN